MGRGGAVDFKAPGDSTQKQPSGPLTPANNMGERPSPNSTIVLMCSEIHFGRLGGWGGGCFGDGARRMTS